MNAIAEFLKQVKFNTEGLVPAIAQDAETGEVLMLAWQNTESLRLTLEKQEMVYYSRSRQCLWHKGESSGHTQAVVSIAMDCDGDTIVAKVKQQGGIACHTGRKSCFYRQFCPQSGVVDNAPVIKDPAEIYVE
ncbi:MAG: phosphoribosyl-AMP cyclohydrolase [Gammaproteobacteria bacterium]|nr:MAG: phosphoribosyl-AMP cyclohydrolase [Gammaproteobacteria bacterium]